jgi:hypothetical protein
VLNSNTKIMRRIPLIDLLGSLDPSDAKYLILFMAEGIVAKIKDGRVSLDTAEKMLFNVDVHLFCKKVLKDSKLRNIIECGMELEDVEEIARNDGSIARACTDIQKLMDDIHIKLL